MDDFIWLVLLCLAMLVGSFVAGMLPLSFHLSDDKMRSISTFGVGLLVGTALMVIIPEGIDAVYSTAMTAALAGASPVGHHHKRNEEERHSPAEGLHSRIGFALLSGFVLMFLVDQMNGGSSHPTSSHTHTISLDTELQGLTSLEANNEEDEDHLTTPGTGRTAHSRNPSAQSTLSEVTSPRLGPRRTSVNYPPSPTLDPGSTSPKRFPLSPAPPRPSSFTLGLIVHAAFDGVALGASAHAPTLSLIVFFAIMLHKAPSAFGLCAVLLRENGMNRFIIRRHLLIFSLAAPLAAILTYAGLRWAVGLEPAASTDSDNAGTGIEYWTGLGLLFSGGTFLYVAMHVMQDVMGHGTSNKWQTIWIVSGMFTPVLLGSFGHGH